MKILLYAILIYFLYLLIFRLVIPVYLASRKIKQGFREMQEKMESQMIILSSKKSNEGFRCELPAFSRELIVMSHELSILMDL